MQAQTNQIPEILVHLSARQPRRAPPTSQRSNVFDGGHGYLVTHPSIGGIVIAKPSPVDLQHLNLPRTHDTAPSSNPEIEDDLSLHMLRLGAAWWPDWATYARHENRMEDPNEPYYGSHFPAAVAVGYPSTGGVWVARHMSGQGLNELLGHVHRSRQQGGKALEDLPARPRGWGPRMRMVLTMDEKCDAMKDFGAVFYEKVEDCPHVAKTLEEGRGLFRTYEGLLAKADDPGYLNSLFPSIVSGLATLPDGRVVKGDPPLRPVQGIWLPTGDDRWTKVEESCFDTVA